MIALVLVLAAPLGTTSADARIGGGFSFGSRGVRTFSAPPSTFTAPRPAAPMQRTETPNLGAQTSGPGASFGQPRRFGFGSGLAAGLLGAGLFGMMTGNGFFGGIGSLFSLIGFLFQFALIGGVIWLIFGYFRSRNGGPAYAGRPGPMPRAPLAGVGAGLGSGLGGRPAPVREAVPISPQDYAAFERTLVDLQSAYGREDFGALSRMTTPEMLRFLGSDLEENRRRGLLNDVTDAKLLQGDLAESWREGATDYATVAMRFSARDIMIDRTTGQLASGDPKSSVEATELWTFRRDRSSPWLLSAIQQTG